MCLLALLLILYFLLKSSSVVLYSPTYQKLHFFMLMRISQWCPLLCRRIHLTLTGEASYACTLPSLKPINTTHIKCHLALKHVQRCWDPLKSLKPIFTQSLWNPDWCCVTRSMWRKTLSSQRCEAFWPWRLLVAKEHLLVSFRLPLPQYSYCKTTERNEYLHNKYETVITDLTVGQSITGPHKNLSWGKGWRRPNMQTRQAELDSKTQLYCWSAKDTRLQGAQNY